MNTQESEALLSIAVLAARADGARVPAEREELEAIAGGLAAELPGGAERARLGDYARALLSPDAREDAFQSALAVCEADGKLSSAERALLSELAGELGLEGAHVRELEVEADELAVLPLAGAAPANEAEAEELIRRTAILCGGLELLPQRLASLAILPLQMRMVYRIGKLHGYELDGGHVKDFLATVGLGLSSQMLEGFARRFVGHLLGRVSGGFLSGLGRSATGSAFTYASTTALGRLAQRYYAGGRTLSGTELKGMFSSLVDGSRNDAARDADAMRASAGNVKLSELSSLVKGL